MHQYNYDVYHDKHQELPDTLHIESPVELSTETTERIRNVLRNSFYTVGDYSEVFSTGNFCSVCEDAEQARFDSEEGMRTAWEIIDG